MGFTFTNRTLNNFLTASVCKNLLKTSSTFFNMKRALSCLLRPFRWLKRFRHRCGYGIHSPFAFQFVTGVIYEKGEYYAYDALENLYRQESNHELRLKDCKLLFRLANFAHAKTAYEALGEENTARTALKMGSQSSVFLEKPGPATLICLGTNFRKNGTK